MKPKIYLIPGTMCNERLWERLKVVGSKEFDFVHLSIPNEESIDKIADAITDKLPLNEFILVGFSFGGYISSCIATKIPERIKHLFVISNSPCSLDEKELSERERNIELINRYGYRGISTLKATSLIDADSINDDLVRTIIEMDSEMGVEALLNQLIAGSDRPDLSVPLSNASVNITFVFSENDKLINKQWISSFSRNNPKCNAVPIHGSGHMLPLEKPYEIVEILKCSQKL